MFADRQKIAVLSLLITSFLLYSFSIYISPPQKNEAVSLQATRGKLAWQRYNCVACHQVYGLGGYLGPDLTNTYSQKGAAYIKVFLANGTATMPNFHLSDAEIAALLAYLQQVDASGSADPRSYTIQPDGTIQQQTN